MGIIINKIKIIFITSIICFVCLFHLYGKTNNNLNNDGITHKLYRSFSTIITDCYGSTNEDEAFWQFVREYYRNVKDTSKRTSQFLNLSAIQKENISKINNKLFNNKNDNFDYFYNSIKYYESNNKPEEDSRDIVLLKKEAKGTNENEMLRNNEIVHYAYLNPKGGFVDEIKEDQTDLGEFVLNEIDYHSIILCPMVAKLLLRKNERNTYKNLKTIDKKIISVVFWNFLCFEADIEFQ